jgi:hypothetical protein
MAEVSDLGYNALAQANHSELGDTIGKLQVAPARIVTPYVR